MNNTEPTPRELPSACIEAQHELDREVACFMRDASALAHCWSLAARMVAELPSQRNERAPALRGALNLLSQAADREANLLGDTSGTYKVLAALDLTRQFEAFEKKRFESEGFYKPAEANERAVPPVLCYFPQVRSQRLAYCNLAPGHSGEHRFDLKVD